MTDERPAPPVPADCDLRSFDYMPLDVKRLQVSKLALTGDGEAFRAAVLLWCASWQQVPASSLPNDEVELARYAGFGRNMKGWKKVREQALYGFVLCSDNRLYHTVVAEKALEATKRKRSYEGRTAAATQVAAERKKSRSPHGRDINPLEKPARNETQASTDSSTDSSTDRDASVHGTNKRIREEKKKEESLFGTTSEIPNKNRDSAQSPPANAGAISPPEPPEDDPSGGPEEQYWALAKSAQIKGIPRSMLGKYAKLLNGDFVAAVVNLKAALRTSEPSKYFAKIVTTASQLLADEPRSTPKKNGKLPEWVRRFADEGYECVPHKTNPGWWRIGRDVYNAHGELEGA